MKQERVRGRRSFEIVALFFFYEPSSLLQLEMMIDESKPTLEARLEHLEALTKENNQILHGLRRTQRWHRIWAFARIGVIVLGFAMGYAFVAPYIAQIAGIYEDVQNTTVRVESLQKQLSPILNFLR